MALSLLTTLVLVGFSYVDFAVGHCNQDTGPVGRAECVRLHGYIGAQWATCLSNEYIQEKSFHRHICQDLPTGGKPTFCYYQCQLEVNSKEYGLVTGKCKCDPQGDENAPNLTPNFDFGDYENLDWDDLLKNLGNYNSGSKTTTPAPIVLPDWCLSPDGTNCKWFNSCLNKKYPCPATENGYVLDFAEQFCHLNLNSYSFNQDVIEFSSTGLRWVNAVRKCLQVSLVPQIRPWMSPTCKDIKLEALSTHEMCYKSASPDAPSVCDLACQDWSKFFWTVKSKGEFLRKVPFADTLKTAVEVMSTCGQNTSIVGPACPTKILRLNLKAMSYYNERRNGHERDNLAGEVAGDLAKRLNWDNTRMGWFAYAPNITKEYSDIVTIDILLGDLTKLAINDNYYNQVKEVPFNMKNITDDLASALEQGMLYDLKGEASVMTLEGCTDMLCSQTWMNTTAGPRPTHAPLKLKSAAAGLNLPLYVTFLCGAIIGLARFWN